MLCIIVGEEPGVGAAPKSYKSKIWGKAMRRKTCAMAAVAMFALDIAAAGGQPNAVKVMAPVIGIVNQVLVQTGDKVIADEPLIHLDDEEARARDAPEALQSVETPDPNSP
jgi:multidrug resistance efflux pump